MTCDVQHLQLDGIPAPKGHYSQAARFGDLLFISGQLPESTDLAETGFEDQARSAIGKLLAILRAAGGRPDGLLKVTAYIVGVSNWVTFDRIYADMLGTARPARAVVPVPVLHYGFQVEIEAVATCWRGVADE